MQNEVTEENCVHNLLKIFITPYFPFLFTMPLIYLQYKINFFSSKMISYTEVQLIQHSALTCDIVGVYVCVKSLWALTNSLLGSFRTSVVPFLFFLIAFVVKTVTNWLLLEVTEHTKLGQHLCQQQVLLGTARRFLPLLKEMYDNWWFKVVSKNENGWLSVSMHELSTVCPDL